jgi:hypothetical protein
MPKRFRDTIRRTVIAIAWDEVKNQFHAPAAPAYKPIATYRAGDERRPVTAAGRARRARLCSSPARMQPYL